MARGKHLNKIREIEDEKIHRRSVSDFKETTNSSGMRSYRREYPEEARQSFDERIDGKIKYNVKTGKYDYDDIAMRKQKTNKSKRVKTRKCSCKRK